MADPSDASFGNQGDEEEDRTRPPASSGQLRWRSEQKNTSTASSSMADQSTSFGNDAAAAGEENRRELATHASRLPSTSSFFNSMVAAAIATDVAAAAVDTANAVASTAYSFNYHPPFHPSFSIPYAGFQPELDLGARDVYSMLVCSTDHQFAGIMTQFTEDYLKEMISRIVSERYRNIFLHIAQHPRGSNHLARLITRNSKVAKTILPAICDSDHFLYLVNHEYGSVVVKATLVAIDEPQRALLYCFTEQNAVTLARNPIGHRFLMDCIHLADGLCKTRILNVIVANVRILSSDPFGALVIQRALDLGDVSWTQLIAVRLNGDYAALSSQPLGSQIVDRILSSPHWKAVAEELLRDHDTLPLLANNPYGYYIVRRILCIASQSNRECCQRMVLALSSWIHILQHGELSAGIVGLIHTLSLQRW